MTFITGRLIFRSTKGLGLAPSAVHFSLICLSARSFWVFHFQDFYYMGFLGVCQGVLGDQFCRVFPRLVVPALSNPRIDLKILIQRLGLSIFSDLLFRRDRLDLSNER
jgi:hypothetical protein